MFGGVVIAGLSCFSGAMDIPNVKDFEGMSNTPIVHVNDNYTGFRVNNASSSGSFYSDLFQQEVASEKFLTDAQIHAQLNYNVLERSFRKNSIDIPMRTFKIFSMLAHKVAVLDCSVEKALYNQYDDSVDVRLALKYDMCLSFSCFLEDTNTVMCTLHKGKELLFADTMSVSEFEFRVGEVAKILTDEACIS